MGERCYELDQRVRDILGRRVFHGIPMWSFLCSLCARLLQIMKVESWVFGCLYFPFLSLEGPGEDEEEEEGGIMPLNPPWMAFFGVSTRGRTQLRMMRLGLVSGSNATQVHIKERSRRYLARPSRKIVLVLLTFCTGRLENVLCSGPDESGQALSGTRERGLLRVFHTVY